MLHDQFSNTCFQHNVTHLNIQVLLSKRDQIKTLLSRLYEAHVERYILLKETFLNDDNAHIFELLDYNPIYKKQTG